MAALFTNIQIQSRKNRNEKDICVILRCIFFQTNISRCLWSFYSDKVNSITTQVIVDLRKTYFFICIYYVNMLNTIPIDLLGIQMDTWRRYVEKFLILFLLSWKDEYKSYFGIFGKICFNSFNHYSLGWNSSSFSQSIFFHLRQIFINMIAKKQWISY